MSGLEDGNPFGMEEPAAEQAAATPPMMEPMEAAAPEETNGVAGEEVEQPSQEPGPSVAQMNEDSGLKDAREAWRAENAELLKERDEAEAKANTEIEAKAQAYMSEFYEERTAHVSSSKARNREQQEAATVKPVGDVPWERVMSMIDFKFDAGRQKETERERFKSLLFMAKEKNVPVTATVA